MAQAEIAKSIPNGDIAELNKSNQSAADHVTDFDPPIYNIWKQQEKSNISSHFGNSEQRWLDNLLYLYTKPFDVRSASGGGVGGYTVETFDYRGTKLRVDTRNPFW